MKRSEPNRQANLWVARGVPLLLLGILGYSSWVVTDLVCVKYLLDPPPSLQLPRRTGSVIAILVTYYILLATMIICYGRLVQTVLANPGVIPRGPQYYTAKRRRKAAAKALQRGDDPSAADKEASLDADSTQESAGTPPIRSTSPDGVGYRPEDFWKKDVFVCNYDGRPSFCSTCYNYKPDRAHHCRELDRCVYKMDHFCPWVGGIVSETSFKYFVQFTFYGGLFTLHTLVVMAYYYAQRRQAEGFINVHWILNLAFAALFFLFSAGMCASTMQFALINSTTIENLSKKTKVYYLAIYVAPQVLSNFSATQRNDIRLITYPRPPSEQLETLQQNGADLATLSPPHSSSTTAPPQEIRTFAILETKPGCNPWDVGALDNFKEVMGYKAIDWLLPLKQSPLTRHDNPESMYRMGSVVRHLRRDAGIVPDSERSRSTRRRRRRNSHSHSHSRSRSTRRHDGR